MTQTTRTECWSRCVDNQRAQKQYQDQLRKRNRKKKRLQDFFLFHMYKYR